MMIIALIKKYLHIFNTDYTQDVNCQGAWLFKEGSGETVADNSQNSNTGNFLDAGEPAWYNASLPAAYTSWAVDFDGSDDRIDCGSDSSLDDLSSLSVVFWVYNDTDADSDYYVCKNNANGWRIRTRANAGIEMRIDYNTQDLIMMAAGDSLPIGGWHHLVTTWTGSSTATNVKFYVDGIETSYGSKYNGTDGRVTDASSSFRIGGRSSAGESIDSKMTEVAAFERVLDSTEANEIMDSGLQGIVSNPYPVCWLIKNKPTGYACFLNQYLKAKVLEYDPLKLPDGTVW